MIFVNHFKNAQDAQDYFTQHLSPGDYFAKDAAEMKGQWHGRGAEMLRLSGEVAKEDFFALCQNRNPETGEQLTPRNKTDRRALTDFTFDVPKDVSLQLEVGGHDGKGDERILDAFRQSVRETMAEIEGDVKTRVRKGLKNEDRETGNIIWAEHIHRTTRPVNGLPDPQLHCHATVFNATFDETEKRWKAIQLGDVVRDKGYYQAAFHARLAYKLKDLGYGIQKDGNSFRLTGIDRSTIEKFSRRSAVIGAEAERLGIEDAGAKGNLGRRTREKKSKEQASMTQLRAEWDSRLTPEERLAIQTAGSGWTKGDDTITPEQAKEYALQQSFQNASAVSEKRLKAEALSYAVGSIRPEDVADIAQHPEVISQTRGGQVMTTTKTVLGDEVAMLQFAKDGQRQFRPLVNRDSIEETLAGLSAEQRNAALHVLTSRDQVTGIRGGAGTGKTHTLQTVNAVISGVESRSGDFSRVFAFAPSSSASRGELRKVGFKNADTLAALFVSDKAQAQLQRQVMLVDEAGLVSSKDMRRVFDIAKKQEARVILVGDYRQHSSVEAGDAFRLLEKEAGIRYAEMKEIRRQTEPGYRKAVEQLSKGSGKAAQKGFDALDRMGSIVDATGEERHSLLVADYLGAVEDGKSALIIAPTHAEGQRLTDELRRALKERGAIGKEREFIARRSTGWTEAQKGDIRSYEPGMVLEWHQNAKGFTRGDKAVVKHGGGGLVLQKQDGAEAALPTDKTDRFEVYRTRGIALAKGDRIRITKNGEARVEGQAKGTRVNNGDIFTVEGFTREGDIRLEKGRLLPKDWGHMTLGYVDTSYASQSKTVDRVFIGVGNESLAATNQQQWYVSTSRGREMAKVYVEDKQEVRDAIARGGERLSAVELTHTKLKDSWRKRFSRSFERHRVGRFLKQRADVLADHWRRREGVRYA